MNVLITTSSFGKDAIRILEQSEFEVINNPYKRKITQTELTSLLEGVHSVIAGLEQYDYDILSKSTLSILHAPIAAATLDRLCRPGIGISSLLINFPRSKYCAMVDVAV